MKLSVFVVQLAALALASVLGASAAAKNGPCTVTADMSTVTGTCPANMQRCLGEVDLAPEKNDPDSVQISILSGCRKSGYSIPFVVIDETNPTLVGYRVGLEPGLQLGVGGYGGNYMIIALTKDNGDVICYARARTTSGTCLLSDKPTPSGPFPPTADSASAVAAAASTSALGLVVAAIALAAY